MQFRGVPPCWMVLVVSRACLMFLLAPWRCMNSINAVWSLLVLFDADQNYALVSGAKYCSVFISVAHSSPLMFSTAPPRLVLSKTAQRREVFFYTVHYY